MPDQHGQAFLATLVQHQVSLGGMPAIAGTGATAMAQSGAMQKALSQSMSASGVQAAASVTVRCCLSLPLSIYEREMVEVFG
jgi:hypothetical protein